MEPGIRAAAVIVTRGHRVLAFVREDDGHLGIPCGGLEPGETPAEAAVRECREETGMVVSLREVAPYIGFDPVGGCVVATFQADIVDEQAPTHAHEGRPAWVGIRELLESPYGDYNRRALRHFGIRRPIAGKFHSHITLKATSEEAERARALVGGKVTIIEMERAGRQQVDVMLTHHFVTGSRGLSDHLDVVAALTAKARQLEDSGVRVVRVKLEHELLDPKSDSRDIGTSMALGPYTEVHIKCRVDQAMLGDLKAAAASAGWHPSRNPRDTSGNTVTQFVNRRFYDAREIETVEDATTEAVARLALLCEIAEVKIETAILDTNGDLDAYFLGGAP